MGWRRGESWFDTDWSWLQEPASGGAAALELNAPAFFDLSPAALVEAIPDGLAESRRRRAELRRKRDVRKTRTAALVIGPAVIVALATPKLGASRAGEPLAEDPPSLAFRPGANRADGGDAAPSRARRLTEDAAGRPRPAKAGDARTTTFARVDWQRATSHGLPYAGSLHGGTQLPVEGRDWVTWHPVEDRVPNAPGRLFGNDRMLRKLLAVVTSYRTEFPAAPRVVVGDLSFRGGGPMDQHRSHQNGLDVDVYYPRLDRWTRAPLRADQVDRRLAQELLDRFVAAGAEKVFVGYSMGLRGPSEVVIPYPNHGDHMHVRFPAPRS